MRVFDHIDPMEIDRREIHLRLLAITVIFILAVGLGVMMYPAVFAKPMTLSGPTFRTMFFGFCTLSALLIAYLVDRHILISKLRARIVAEERAIQLIQREASKDLLSSLPTMDTFADRLSMEFRRVSRVGQPLSVLAVEITVRAEVCSPQEVALVHADAGRAILRKARGEDSLFLLDPGVFGMLLPRISTNVAEMMKEELKAELLVAAGPVPLFHFRIHIINYPDHVKSAQEIMDAMRPMAANCLIQPLGLEAAVFATGA